jgi:hypothetical protein
MNRRQGIRRHRTRTCRNENRERSADGAVCHGEKSQNINSAKRSFAPARAVIAGITAPTKTTITPARSAIDAKMINGNLAFLSDDVRHQWRNGKANLHADLPNSPSKHARQSSHMPATIQGS